MTQEEMNNTYAGKGTTALSIIGTVLGGLGTVGAGELLGGIGNNKQQYVTKEAFDLSMALNASQREADLLKAELNTEKKMVEVFNSLNTKIQGVVDNQSAVNSAQAVSNCATTSAIAVLQNNVAQLQSLTKIVVPNASINPGWGNVTITPATGG